MDVKLILDKALIMMIEIRCTDEGHHVTVLNCEPPALVPTLVIKIMLVNDVGFRDLLGFRSLCFRR
jgi:hypothetical protein